jgi:hypothetical protein
MQVRGGVEVEGGEVEVAGGELEVAGGARRRSRHRRRMHGGEEVAGGEVEVAGGESAPVELLVRHGFPPRAAFTSEGLAFFVPFAEMLVCMASALLGLFLYGEKCGGVFSDETET